jgi:hypothetical protein
MKTNSTTEFFDAANVARACKVDSILSVVMSIEMFPQAQIRSEKWEKSRCIYNVRFMNDGACTDAWLDGTEVDSCLMRSWLKGRQRSSRTMNPHDYATYPFQCYFSTPQQLVIAGLAVCEHGKYKGKTCKEIFEKDPGYCICMLEMFAESQGKMRVKDTKSMGHFCRYLSTLVHREQFYLRACDCTSCAM